MKFLHTVVAGNTIKGAPASGTLTGMFGDIYSYWQDGRLRTYGHRGVDIACPIGTPVLAPCSGVVTLHRPGDGWGDGSFGMMAVIDWEGTPFYVGMAHMSAFSVLSGQRVEAKTVLGLSGNTGLSSGPHVHWQVCRDSWFGVDANRSVDPLSLLGEPMQEDYEMTPEEREEHRAVVKLLGGRQNLVHQAFTNGNDLWKGYVQEQIDQNLLESALPKLDGRIADVEGELEAMSGALGAVGDTLAAHRANHPGKTRAARGL